MTSPLVRTSALAILRRDLRIALGLLLVSFFFKFTLLFPGIDPVGLVLCAYAATRVIQGRRVFLQQTQMSHLPVREALQWVGILILVGIKLLTAVPLPSNL
ncbi:hypothetical protein [Deinococcus sp. 6GRE01]|uniref:hypothetical protein n=1 Tax=Deinococcus sp. 6GRE01 TaxID=2745873 RepID=UPI001E3EDC5B|nr:hypothetical protein [Deinococcus sp. 6GRE01]MCD0159020.1 hypothetical protein [Deinococcus sp. 6GRE01]